MNILTRITNRRIPFVRSCLSDIIKNRRPGPYNSLRHADNRKYFPSLSNTKSKGNPHVSLGQGSGKDLELFLLIKGNFTLISEFKYGQIGKI